MRAIRLYSAVFTLLCCASALGGRGDLGGVAFETFEILLPVALTKLRTGKGEGRMKFLYL